MSLRALITGANGFVGRQLGAHLAARGWEVVRTDFGDVDEVIACDISDPGQVRAMLDQAGPISHVFHLAALTFVPEASRKPESAMSVNYGGTVNLVRTLSERDMAARFLYVSSSGVYGVPERVPVTEADPLRPANPYSISKAAADFYCQYAARAGELDIVRLRPFNHTGPGQSGQFVLPSFARQIAQIEAGAREPVLHVGNLDAARDFLHVDDVVRAYELAAVQARPAEAYNVCSGTAYKIADALEQLRALSPVEIEVRTDPERLRPADVPEMRGDHGKLTTETGWKPQVRFEQLLEELLGYWRAQETEA